MTGTADIINPAAMLTVITKMDVVTIMVGTISTINLEGILTGITKSGMDINVAGTKNNIYAGITNTIDIIIGRLIGTTIITPITMSHMKETLSDSS